MQRRIGTLTVAGVVVLGALTSGATLAQSPSATGAPVARRWWLRADRRRVDASTCRPPTARCWRSRRSTPRAASSASPSTSSSMTASTTWASPPRPPSSSWRRTRSRPSSATPTRTPCSRRRRCSRRPASPTSRSAPPRPRSRPRPATRCSWPPSVTTSRRRRARSTPCRTLARPPTCCPTTASSTRPSWAATSSRRSRPPVAPSSWRMSTRTRRPTSRPRSPSSRPSPTQPDFYYIAAMPYNVGPVVKQFRDAGLTGPIVGGDGYDAPDLVEVAGAAADNVFFTTHALMDADGRHGWHQEVHHRLHTRSTSTLPRMRSRRWATTPSTCSPTPSRAPAAWTAPPSIRPSRRRPGSRASPAPSPSRLRRTCPRRA